MKAIAAVDKNWGIGYEGDMLVSLKQDMTFFTEMTMDRTIIMGRKTLDSFPGGNPLKHRKHIVFSHKLNDREGATVIKDIEALKALNLDLSDTYVVGGEAIYRLLLPYCDTALITKMDAAFTADTYFPNLDKIDNWKQTEVIDEFIENGIQAQIIKYTNSEVRNL